MKFLLMTLAATALLISPAQATKCYYWGTTGDDVITARDGCDDVVVGYDTNHLHHDGDDILTSGNGWDELIGGPGADILTSGEGYDIYYYNFASDSLPSAPDTITDFEQGYDVIGLAGVMWNAGQLTGSFIGTSPFSGTAGEVRYRLIYQPDGTPITVLEADVDGDGHSDFRINLLGNYALTNTDILWSFPAWSN